MFTGIVSALGTLRARTVLGVDARLRLQPNTLAPFTHLVRGESIAVNGTCLSVETFTTTDFWVYASEETLSHTTLGDLALTATVNLERALCLGDRLGGHLVTGHIDCVATVTKVALHGQSRQYTLRFPTEIAEEIAPKGSVTLDGISLTVNACGPDWCTVNIIPETQASTTAGSWVRGTRINLETDILGKYVHRHHTLAASSLSTDFLKRHGYF